MAMTFNSTILTFPGLGSSGPRHWQTYWEKRFGFTRIEQQNWDTPVCADWVATIEEQVRSGDNDIIIIVAHSLACSAIGHWAKNTRIQIKGALLVSPADTEADTLPPGTSGFSPMPLKRLPFETIVVTSSNDPYVKPDRAQFFAKSWGSRLVNIGPAGHINTASGHHEWTAGLEFLQSLDQRKG